MYIYNVTTNIEDSVHQEWLKWMKETHIPDVLATGKFLSAKMCRVIVEEEMGGVTYSVQYTAKDREILQKYYEEDASRLRQDALKLYAGKTVSFRTELEVVNESHKAPLLSSDYLFTYGSLQEKSVQERVFGRLLTGGSDRLIGYSHSDEKVLDTYPVILRTNQVTDTVTGKVYLITPSELRRADIYEGEMYQRVYVDLESGKKAWVYIKNESSH